MKRRIIASVAAALVATMVLAGCNGNNGNEQASTASSSTPATASNASASASPTSSEEGGLSWTKDTTPFEFSQFFYGNWATNYLWKDQLDMKLIQDKTGVSVDRKLATGNDDDYLNTMIASGDLPDTIMLDWSHPAVSKLINNNMLYSIDELIEKYAPEFKDMLDPEMVKYHSVNGKLWYLPNFYETKEFLKNSPPKVSVRPWFIRADILKAIDNPKIDSVESLRSALLLIKQKFPDISPVGLEPFDVNGNGYAGSRGVPLLISAFDPNLSEESIDNDKQIVQLPVRRNGFIDAFRYLNQLYRDGLVDPQLLIFKQDQYEERLYGAKYAVATEYMQDMYIKFNAKIESTLGADLKYQSLGPLKANGNDPRYEAARGMGWQGLFITKNAKNPERIIRFAEYAWTDEGQMDMRYGKEGETYDLVDGLPKLNPDLVDLSLKDPNAYNAKYGFENSTLLWRAGEKWDQANTRDMKQNYPEMFATASAFAEHNFDNFNLGLNNLEPDSSTPEATISLKVKEMWNKTIPKLVLSKSDDEFNKIYDEFIGQIDKIGAEKLEKAMYQRHLMDLEKKGIQ